LIFGKPLNVPGNCTTPT